MCRRAGRWRRYGAGARRAGLIGVFGLWRVCFPPCLVRPGRRLPVQGLSEESLGCRDRLPTCQNFLRQTWKSINFRTNSKNRVCFLVLCKRHWINRGPGAHRGECLCIPSASTLTLAMPIYLVSISCKPAATHSTALPVPRVNAPLSHTPSPHPLCGPSLLAPHRPQSVLFRVRENAQRLAGYDDCVVAGRG